VSHHRAVGLEPLAMERGLAEAPLPRVELALARQQAFAQERLRPLDAPALHEVVLARDQHLADVVRVDEEVDLALHDPAPDDVALLAGRAREEGERVLPHREQRAHEGRALRSAGTNSRSFRRPVGDRGPAHADSTPSARPTFVKAATARSTCSGRCAAESWTRIRDWPRGTTGKKKPLT